jgi:hypothetical protein
MIPIEGFSLLYGFELKIKYFAVGIKTWLIVEKAKTDSPSN